MKRLLAVLLGTGALLLSSLVVAQPAEARYYDTFSDQATSRWTACFSDCFPTVQVKMFAHQSISGDQWVVEKIWIDAWEKGTNPQEVPCPQYLDNTAVTGDVYLRKWDGSGVLGYTTMRHWDVTLGNGDGCHQELLGGDNQVVTGQVGIWASYEDYTIHIDSGSNRSGKTAVMRWQKPTDQIYEWWIQCSGSNIIVCDEDGPL